MRGRRNLFSDSPSPGTKAELARRRQEQEELEEEISRKKAELAELEKQRGGLEIYSGTPPTTKPAKWRGSPWRGVHYNRSYREERARQYEEANNVLATEKKEEDSIRTQRNMEEAQKKKPWRLTECVGCAQPAQLACSACRAEFYCSKDCQESSKQCNC